MASSRFNALDQILDIKGSSSLSSTRTLTDETAGLGASLPLQTGAAATTSAAASGVSTVTGLTGMTAGSVGNFLTLTGAGDAGTFLIVSFVSASSVTISNPTAAGSTGLGWAERRPYSLNDDLDFERTDRAAIKGVAFDAAIPTYERPTALGTAVPANLSNIAGKTTDAQGFIFTRKFNDATAVVAADTITITSAGNLKHSDDVDKTGVPCSDEAPYVGNAVACYVEILNDNGEPFEVLAGPQQGEKIFGLSQGGSSLSPNSVEVALFSVPFGDDISGTITAYAWEAGQPTTTVDLFYGYFQQLNEADENAFRTISSLGVEESGSLRQDITDLQAAVGVSDGDTFLEGLTNTGNYFPFVTVGASPTVTAALNKLNEQIGARNYTTPTDSPYLTDGETITASLMALSNAIASANIVRYIDRLAADVVANTARTLPGGADYVLDVGGNGKGLSVYTRGILRDPGTIVDGDDYAETSTTSVTFFSALRAGDHINYYVYG